jgi:transcriptional regulator with XRE-family HTH domain
MNGGEVTSYAAVVGRVLDSLRTERDMKQGALAESVGVGQSTWSRIEKGEVAISIDQLARAAAALGINPSDILLWADQVVASFTEEKHGTVLTDKPAEIKKNGIGAGALLLGAGALAAIVWAARQK